MAWGAGLTERLINWLRSVSNRLSTSLDRAIYKLDRFRRELILRFYRALRVMEKLFRVSWEILKVLFPIVLTFLPPFVGFLLAFLVMEWLSLNFFIVIGFSTVLALMLVFAYLATEEGEDTNYKVLQAQERLVYVSDLSEYSVGMKLFGAGIVVCIFVGLWFVNPGLFTGIVLFLLEFAIILLLPKIYRVPAMKEGEPSSA